ncbi:MAG: CsbD family protein [Pirellulales bacterium]
MKWDTVKGQWKQVRGRVKEQWGKLTDDDLDRIEGKRDQLLGTVQIRYGLAREEAEKQIRDFESTLAGD